MPKDEIYYTGKCKIGQSFFKCLLWGRRGDLNDSSPDAFASHTVDVWEDSGAANDAAINQAVSKAYNAGWTLAQKHNPWIDEDTYGKVFDAVVTLAEQGYSEDRVKALYPNYEYSIGNQAFSAAYAAGMAMRSRSKAVQKSDVQSRKSFTTDDGYDTIDIDANEGAKNNVG